MKVIRMYIYIQRRTYEQITKFKKITDYNDYIIIIIHKYILILQFFILNLFIVSRVYVSLINLIYNSRYMYIYI